jgi:hypothetical protein
MKYMKECLSPLRYPYPRQGGGTGWYLVKKPVSYLKLTRERLTYTYVTIEKGTPYDHGNRDSSRKDCTGLKGKQQ